MAAGAARKNGKKDVGAFVVNGVRYPVPKKFTLGDLDDLEAAGFVDPDTGRVRLLGMLYVSMRQKNPEITIEEVRAIDSDSFDSVDGGEDRPPTRKKAAARATSGDQS